jgi:hypothetical protein
LTIASDAQARAAVERTGKQSRLTVSQRLLEAVAWLTTPLLPDDYLELVDPLWSSRQISGRVEHVQPETSDVATVVIRPGRGWTGHRAGQYVRVGVEVDGVRHWRSFSMSSPPQRPDGCITITVKAARAGLVSPYLVHRITGSPDASGGRRGGVTWRTPLPWLGFWLV